MARLATVFITAVAVYVGTSSAVATEPRQLVQTICIACHNQYTLAAGMNLDGFDPEKVWLDPEIARRMVRKLRAGQMPPKEIPRDPEDINELVQTLETSLSTAARKEEWVGTRPFPRVNRAEYARLIKDVLGLTVDPAEWLPQDRLSASFDNITDVQGMSATLVVSYLNAASDIARRAIGNADAPAVATTYTNSPLVSQHAWERVDGAPRGTRGGISVLHNFPADGKYALSMRFRLGYAQRFHDIDISIDGERVALLQYGGDIDYQGRKEFPIESEPVFITAGEHRLTAAFIRQQDGPYPDLLRPNKRSLAGIATGYGTTALPHLMQLTVEGPYDPTGVSATASRRLIFSCRPTAPEEEEDCAREIITRLAAKAYGEPLSQDQSSDLMAFYAMGTKEGGFESGIQTALEAILSSPAFLFRTEVMPDDARPGESYPLAGTDIATRLSFFLWGTNPDAELLALAASGDLSRPRVLRQQAERMLADPRSIALAVRFASLWLRLQDLEQLFPDEFLFPDYNEQLAEAMRRETQLFFHHLVKDDRSFLELYSADYSYMNERLAEHYGIPGVTGEEFRRVDYPTDRRVGIFGHGSVLSQTSLGNRTSPVLRGKWVLEVLLGTPPPPPPPGVPDLEETKGSKNGEVLSTRERLEMHRSNPVCAACHKLMDPIGLAMDNFDVTGKWRTRENGVPLDTRATFYDGTEISTPADLSRVLLERPLPLVRQFTENLLSYALGRRVEPYDMPLVWDIVADAEENGYKMSSLILGVIMSDTFRMKVVPPDEQEITAETVR